MPRWPQGGDGCRRGRRSHHGMDGRRRCVDGGLPLQCVLPVFSFSRYAPPSAIRTTGPPQSEVVCIPLLLVYTTFGAAGLKVSQRADNGVFHGDLRVDTGILTSNGCPVGCFQQH